MTVVHWRRLSISLLLAALFSACDNPDPLAPSFAATRGAPAAPTNLTATALSYQDISLVWQDNSTNESGWEVYRSLTGPTGTFTLFTVYSGQNITQGGNSGLQASTQYCYSVRAFSTSGQSGKVRAYSDFSNTACATTPALPVPAAPSDVSAAPDAWGRIRVTWTDNAGNENGFRVERSATSSGPWSSIATIGPNGVSFDDWQAPTAEQPACYRVIAYNGYGDSQSSNVDCTAKPAPPSGLVASVSGSDVSLAWTDNSGVEDGFQVRRWTQSEGTPVVVATLPANATTYHDVGLADNTYSYQVLATKDGGTSTASNNASAVVATVPPLSPSGADANPAGSSVVAITWGDATTEAGYRVERSIDGGASWVVAGTSGLNETWFYDVAQPSERQLCYRIIAFNGAGDSPPSNMDCTTLPAAPSNLLATAGGSLGEVINLTWADNSGVEDGYEVQRLFTYCDWDACYSYFETIAILGPDATSYSDSWDILPGNTYTYLVYALKDGGRSDASNEATSYGQ
jgi:fibronectin type 3 domain-containing protein